MSEEITPKTRTTAIRGITLVPMDSERVLKDQTLIVENGRISTFGPADEVQIPAESDVVEGGGAYLLPGLANMHAHLADFDPDPGHLLLYLVGGVTTIRSLNTPWKLQNWREKIASGEWLGPTIIQSGPAIVDFPREYRTLALAIISGWLLLFGLVYGLIWILASPDIAADFARNWGAFWLVAGILGAVVVVWKKIIPLTKLAEKFLPQAAVVETAAQAASEVRHQANSGVDFVKLYDYLDRKSYFAALAAAREVGIYAAGHIPDDPEIVRVEEALEAGLKEIVHTDEMAHEFLAGYTPSNQEWIEWEVEMDRIDDVAAIVANSRAAVTATLVTNETVLLGLEDIDALFERPEYQTVRPDIIEQWRNKGRLVNWRGQERYRRERLRPLWRQLTYALHRRGVPILLGTDTGVEGIVPGFSEHRELALLVEAGLTPFAALAAGTRDAAIIARRMGVASDWGTIEVGNRADLILVAENPLEDVTHTEKILGVMVRGQWFEKADLDRRIASVSAR